MEVNITSLPLQEVSTSTGKRKANYFVTEDDYSSSIPAQNDSTKRPRISYPTLNIFEDDGRQEEVKQTLKLDTLQSLIDKNPPMIVAELTRENSGYGVLLDKEFDPNVVAAVIKLLGKAVTAKFSSSGLRDLLFTTFSRPNFLSGLNRFICEAQDDVSKIGEFVPLICLILDQIIKQSCSVASKSVIENLLYLCFGVIKETTDNNSTKRMIIDNLAKLQIVKPNQSSQSQTEHPLDSFRNQHVIPTSDELNDNRKPFLRSLLTKGAYDDSEHYLGAHFRLLKEDFVRPLREGLQHFRTSSSSGRDVRVYKWAYYDHACIEGPDLIYYLKLRLPEHFRSNESKKLMFGNILCISCDNFETMILASVKNRDKLCQGLLGIVIEGNENISLKTNVIYSVIESKAYFVSYMHTLKALKELNRVPFEDYIVKGIETNAFPKYINESSAYVLEKKRFFGINNSEEPKVILGNKDTWPSCHDLGLDESQFCALKAALTRQVTIIQGPPGTGKTFLGLKITEILLQNLKVWNTKDAPILVVCFTNHALDQFLEGISSFTQKIVRVGSRSKNANLVRFQLKAIRNSHFYKPTQKSNLSQKLAILKSELSSLYKANEEIKINGILSPSSFTQGKYSVISNYMRGQLKRFTMQQFLTMSERANQSVFGRLDNYSLIPSPQENDFWHSNVFYEPPSHVAKSVPENQVDYELNRDEEYHRMLDESGFDEVSSEKVASQNSSNTLKLEFEITSEEVKNGNPQQRLIEGVIKTISSVELDETMCEILENFNIHVLPLKERLTLYCYWKKKLKGKIQESMNNCELKYKKTLKKVEELSDIEYLNIMRESKVIGMTTTGAARYCKLLHQLAPPIGKCMCM